jgi:hypothetical protein
MSGPPLLDEETTRPRDHDPSRKGRLRLIVIIVIGSLLLMLAATQLFLPGYLEHTVEDRLTADGGSVSVTLRALPALRLLAHDGDKLSIDGHDLVSPIRLSDLGSRSLDDLDGFDEVDIQLARVHADPFEVRDFSLTRPEDSDHYRLRVRAITSAQALVRYGSAQLLPGTLAPLFGGAAAALAQRGQIPVDLNASIASDDGRPRVVTAHGTVAGLQVGPLVELLAGAVLSPI